MGVYLAIYGAGLAFAWVIGASKGRGFEGFLCGLLLSWVGVLIILLVKPTAHAEGRRPCPYCSEMVLPTASVCPHCQRDIAPLDAPPAGTGEGWLPDPSGRYPDRWWDGSTWTQWVRDAPGGTRSEDPPVRA